MKKHVLVIGGTRGLGKVVVNALLNEENRVSVLARNIPEDHEEKVNNLLHVQGDLLDQNSFIKAISDIAKTNGKINSLIFLQRYRGIGDCWTEELEVTLNSTRKIIDYIVEESFFEPNTDTSIIMMSSIAAVLATDSQPLSYSVAKAGLNQMVRHYAALLGPKGVRVNAVSTFSFLKEESHDFYLKNKDLYQLYQKIVPLNRMCKTDDVANVILFLCGSKSSFITGQNIVVDGGLSVINHELLARTVGQI